MSVPSSQQLAARLNDAFPPAQQRALRFISFPLTTSIATAQTATQSDATNFQNTELALGLDGGKTYKVTISAPLSIANAAHGIAFDLNGGTCTASLVTGSAQFRDAGAATVLNVASAALNTVVSGGTATAWDWCEFDAVITVSVGGTLRVRIRQAASGASNSVLSAGASIVAIEC